MRRTDTTCVSSSRPEGPDTSQGRPSKPSPKHAATRAIRSRSSSRRRCVRSWVCSPSRSESGASGSSTSCPMISEKRTSLPPMVKDTKSTACPGGRISESSRICGGWLLCGPSKPGVGPGAAAREVDEGDRRPGVASLHGQRRPCLPRAAGARAARLIVVGRHEPAAGVSRAGREGIAQPHHDQVPDVGRDARGVGATVRRRSP